LLFLYKRFGNAAIKSWQLEVDCNLLEVVSPLWLSGSNISRSTAAVSFSTDKHLDKMGVWSRFGHRSSQVNDLGAL